VTQHPEWALGYEDETWWSRVAQPNLHAWTLTDQPLRLLEKTVPRDDAEKKALACYGLLVRWHPAGQATQEQLWLRFADGNPCGALTIQFLAWGCDRLQAVGQHVWALVWDNASWHLSQPVRDWIRDHNRQVKREGQGVRILCCPLPKKSPWLNPIEPMWIHGKRRVVEPERVLMGQELEMRVCETFGCSREPHLSIPAKVS
jgi:hypothetical protein